LRSVKIKHRVLCPSMLFNKSVIQMRRKGWQLIEINFVTLYAFKISIFRWSLMFVARAGIEIGITKLR
jgi:hypothetical protein